MSGLSIYGRDQMLSAFFIPTLFVELESIWVALTTVTPTAGDTGNDLVEPSVDAGYVRQSYGIDVDYWRLTGRGGATNLAEITFGIPAADWGDITGWALCTDAEGGQTYYVGELTNPMRVYYDPEVDREVIIGVEALVVKQT